MSAARVGSNGPRPLAHKNRSGELGGKRLLEAAASWLLVALCLLSPGTQRGRDSPPTHTLPLSVQGCRGGNPVPSWSRAREEPVTLPVPNHHPCPPPSPAPHLLRSPAQDAFADGRGGLVLEQSGAAALLPAVLLRRVLVGLERGVLVAGSPAAAAGPRRCLLARRRLRRRELLVVLERVGLARRRRGLLGRGPLGRRGGGRRLGGGRLLPTEVAVLGAQLVQPPLQLVDALALGVDEALLVLHDGGELLQVEHSAHRVLQQALHAPAAGPGPPARPPALRRERRGLRGGASPPHAHTHTRARARSRATDGRSLAHSLTHSVTRRARAREGRRGGPRACPHAPRAPRTARRWARERAGAGPAVQTPPLHRPGRAGAGGAGAEGRGVLSRCRCRREDSERGGAPAADTAPTPPAGPQRGGTSAMSGWR